MRHKNAAPSGIFQESVNKADIAVSNKEEKAAPKPKKVKEAVEPVAVEVVAEEPKVEDVAAETAAASGDVAE